MGVSRNNMLNLNDATPQENLSFIHDNETTMTDEEGELDRINSAGTTVMDGIVAGTVYVRTELTMHEFPIR